MESPPPTVAITTLSQPKSLSPQPLITHPNQPKQENKLKEKISPKETTTTLTCPPIFTDKTPNNTQQTPKNTNSQPTKPCSKNPAKSDNLPIRLSHDNWNAWLLSHRGDFSAMVWSVLLHSECIQCDNTHLVIGLADYQDTPSTMQDKVKEYVHTLLPQPLTISIKNKNPNYQDTLYQHLKNQLLNDITQDPSFQHMQQMLGLTLNEESIKIY